MSRILVVGAGAVGGYFGACLVRAGREVTFLARGESLARLRSSGLSVRSAAGDFAVGPVAAVPEARSLDLAPELVLVCVKRADTRAAVAGLADRLATDAIVLSLQNGIDAAEEVEAILAIPPQPRAVAYVGAELVAPGVVRHDAEGRIAVGEADGGSSERLARVVAELGVPGFGVAPSPVIERLRWQKLAWNASFNLLCAAGRSGGEGVLRTPAGRDLARAVMAEVVAVARASGVAIEPDWIDRMLAATERKLGRVRPSTLQDRERGRRLEHEALTGAVVRRGAALGVATPISRTLDRLGALLSIAPLDASPPPA